MLDYILASKMQKVFIAWPLKSKLNYCSNIGTAVIKEEKRILMALFCGGDVIWEFGGWGFYFCCCL